MKYDNTMLLVLNTNASETPNKSKWYKKWNAGSIGWLLNLTPVDNE